MPSRLPAPEHLLNAIFAHTNQLSWQDRQLILRFLAGEDPWVGGLSTHPNAATPASSSSSSSSNQSVWGQGFGTLPNDEVIRPATNANTDDVGTVSDNNGSSSSSSNHRSSRRDPLCYPIRQILLHEERSTEIRPAVSTAAAPTHNSTAGDWASGATMTSARTGGMATDHQEPSRAASSRTARQSASDSDGEVPSSVTVMAPTTKLYTIIDQIIFEMDYKTGCWRKLRRRIRMADRKSSSTAASSVPLHNAHSMTLASAVSASPSAAPTLNGTSLSSSSTSQSAGSLIPGRVWNGHRQSMASLRGLPTTTAASLGPRRPPLAFPGPGAQATLGHRYRHASNSGANSTTQNSNGGEPTSTTRMQWPGSGMLSREPGSVPGLTLFHAEPGETIPNHGGLSVRQDRTTSGSTSQAGGGLESPFRDFRFPAVTLPMRMEAPMIMMTAAAAHRSASGQDTASTMSAGVADIGR